MRHPAIYSHKTSTLGFSGYGGSSWGEPPWATRGTGDDDFYKGPEKLATTAAERELACIKAGGKPTVTKGVFVDEVSCDIWPEGQPNQGQPGAPPPGDKTLTAAAAAANAAAAALAAKTASENPPIESGNEPATEQPDNSNSSWPAVLMIAGAIAVGGGLLYYAKTRK